MGLFKKKQQVVNIIELPEVKGFIDHTFETLENYPKFHKIKESFNYEVAKLKSYSELLLGPDFEKRVTQDKEYFKKSAIKANNLIDNFLVQITLPKSISKLANFVNDSITIIEEFDNQISVPLNHLNDIMPKLLHRIRLKIDAISEVFAEFNMFIDSDNIKTIKTISDLITEYYSLEKKIASLREQRIPILDELTQVSMMKDRVEARLNSFKSKRSMGNLSELMIERDKIREEINKLSSVLRVKLSYINELLNDKDHSKIKDWIMKFISGQDEDITEEIFSDIKNNIKDVSSGDEKLKELIILVLSFEDKVKECAEQLKNIGSRLHDNILYLNVKEQEDSFDLWNSRFKDLKSKIREIDNTISDISLNLVKQNINKEVQKLSPNTIVE